jgi:hypothetical protein
MFLANVEIGLGKGCCAEPVLVADHHKSVTQVAQTLHGFDDAWHEANLVQGIDLFVGRFLDQGPVTVDEDDF